MGEGGGGEWGGGVGGNSDQAINQLNNISAIKYKITSSPEFSAMYDRHMNS